MLFVDNTKCDAMRVPWGKIASNPGSTSPLDPITDEIEDTSRIGNKIGFRMEANNPILAEIVGGKGENDGPQWIFYL